MPDVLFILVLALVIFGPKKLPEIMRQVAKFVAQFRMMRDDLKRQIEGELLKIELEEKQKPKPAPPQLPANSESVPAAISSGAPSSSSDLTDRVGFFRPNLSPGTGEEDGQPKPTARVDEGPLDRQAPTAG
jgi:sec-independent protein translocase protein TatB